MAQALATRNLEVLSFCFFSLNFDVGNMNVLAENMECLTTCMKGNTSYCTVFLCMLILKLSFAKVKGYAHIYICVQGGTSNETCEDLHKV